MGYLIATTLPQALEALHAPQAAVIAGGTDWFPAQGSKPLTAALVDITRIPGLRGITRDSDGWRIGAATTWTDLIRAPLPPAFDGLKAAAREVGSRQIQNTGTIAGNLCNASPAADGVPPLLTLDATVELTATSGTRHLPLADFLQGPRRTALQKGELLTALHIPDQPDTAQSAFLKLGARHYLVISIAMVAALVTLQQGRITRAAVAVGACSATACRLPALEVALTGQSAAAILAQGGACVAPAHLAPLAPITDIRASATYRTEAAATLVARTLATAIRKAQTHG